MYIGRIKLFLAAFLLVLVTGVGSVTLFLYGMTGDPYSALRLWGGMQIISTQFFEPVDNRKLVDGAIKGMIESLGDPYSAYMDEKTYRDFLNQTEGSFSGIGIELGKKDNRLTVIAPITGTPSERAGIRSGDVILKIDGVDVEGLSLDEIINRIRGKEGTPITLLLERLNPEKANAPESFEVALTRESIVIQTIHGQMLQEGVGYVRISSFNKNTAEHFASKLTELDQQGMKRLVLDLRNNPGGLLDSSVKIAGLLMKEGDVVSTVTRDGQKITQRSGGEKDRYQAVVVLINGGSASASEVVAGALQDREVGTLVGTTSFGKGSVQMLFPTDIGPQSAFRLTIARYFTPNGRSIHGTGLAPDVWVDWSGEGPAGVLGTDPQMQKAVEVLLAK